MTILQLDHVSYNYRDTNAKVLSDISTDFQKGVFYAIVGSSGAGKSTLLSLLAGLDAPTKGTVRFDGSDIADKGYSHHRRDNISLVFQSYNLIDYLTPLENLRLVDSKADIDSLIELGLTPEESRRNVMRLSGGQQQRVALARALVSKAPVILADEPTGNLDEETADEVIDILRSAAHEKNKCVIVVTHAKQVAKAADITLRLARRKLTVQE
uniref:ABC transporter ATP-binding protein n=1 Tax=Vaginimicrobium propionicum TaxID=1871034 RepID=UPI000970CBBA|nr:ABC transporter ATP-binding protein [Vaginimicrobium propionicum]